MSEFAIAAIYRKDEVCFDCTIHSIVFTPKPIW